MRHTPWVVLSVGLLAIVSAACGGGGGSATSPSTSTSTSTSGGSGGTGGTGGSGGVASTWTTEGARFTSSSLGVTGTLADSTTLRLNDGRWRMFIFSSRAYTSLISSDGLSFTLEPGNRLPEGYGHSRVVRLSDGRVRMFSISNNGLASLISSDEGQTFTVEGMRVTNTQAGLNALSGCGIVQMPDGRWRMYFSELDTPGAAITPLPMKSAVSSDMLTWTMDSGVRIGPGATVLTGSAAHPTAVLNSNGSVTVFYFRNSDLKLYAATAADGLAFTSETAVLTSGADPDIVTLPSGGGLRMYYNWFEASSGAYTVSSARAASALGVAFFTGPR